jgi:hypothetical protein
MEKSLDTRKIIPGYNGKLFDDSGNFFAQIPTFNTQININNTDYQPAGSPQVAAFMVSYTVSLTLTETVVADDVLFTKFMDALKNGEQVVFNFQGKLQAPGGKFERLIYRECVPDGTIDLQKVEPGTIIDRAWSMRVNQPPDLQEYIKS